MTKPLNILLVVLDGARADHLGSYGYERETMPFVDRLAREGVRFQHMISTSSWTLPAHASLFTGLFPSAHGATDENRFVAPRHRVLAEYLKDAGYRTAAFCANPWVSPETGFGRGFDQFHTQRSGGRLTGRAAFYARSASDRVLGRRDSGARRTTRALLAWLAEVDGPFFAFVHYNEPHVRFQPPPPYDRIFMPAGIDGARIRAVNQDGLAHMAGVVDTAADDAAILTALYDGELRYTDTRLEEVATALIKQGRWEQTLVIVTADHGADLGEHGLLGHHFALYDTMLRTPLIMRCPGRIPRGFVVDELAQPTDLLPTILDLVDTAADVSHLPGRALIRGGEVTAGPTFTIAERHRPNLMSLQRRFPQFDARRFDVRLKAIRTRREKFIWHSDEDNELYDLVRDPGEADNVIERHGARAESLRRQLFDWFASIECDEGERREAPMDAVMRQQLERLGYQQ